MDRYVWILGSILVAGTVLLWNIVPHRRRLKHFADRDEISLDSIYSQFFAANNSPKRLVFELWNEIAIALRVPPGKLRPSDRFDKELAPLEGWEFDDDAVEVHWVAQRRLKKLGVNQDISQIQTLRDYVEFFCRLEVKGADLNI